MSFLPSTGLGQPWDTLLALAAVLVALGILWKAPGMLWRGLKGAAKAINRVDAVSEATPAIIELAKIAPALQQLPKRMQLLEDEMKELKRGRRVP